MNIHNPCFLDVFCFNSAINFIKKVQRKPYITKELSQITALF